MNVWKFLFFIRITMKRALPFLALAASAFAAEKPCAPSMPVCHTPDTCSMCYCLGPAIAQGNAPIRPYTCNGDIELALAVVYWQANQDGMEYAIDNAVKGNYGAPDPLVRQETNNLVDAEYKSPQFKWNNGFKLGASYNSPCDGWDIGLLWTSYTGKAFSHDHVDQEDNHVLITLWSAFMGGREPPNHYASDIETKWHVDLDLVDIDLGREFWVSRYLALRPHIGLRFSKINQTFHLLHKGGTWAAFVVSPTQDSYNDEVRIDNDFKGVGPRAGFDLNFHLGCGWSIYNEFAASIIDGRFEINHDESIKQAEDPFSKTNVLETEDSIRCSRGALDYALGVQYASLICKCKYRFSAILSWDLHVFFHQNQMWSVVRIAPTSGGNSALPNNQGENVHSHRRGNLSTQGASLTAQFDF